MAYENAVSALGKLLEFVPEAVDGGMGAVYINALPLKVWACGGWVG